MKDVVKIAGVAVKAGLSSNKHMFLAEELQKSFDSLRNKPILRDHEATCSNSIGKVQESKFVGDTIEYSGFVLDIDGLREKIESGVLSEVSVGLFCDQLVKENEDSDVLTPMGIHFLEISIVPCPAVSGTSISVTNSMEDVKMDKVQTQFKGDKGSEIKEDLSSTENLVLEHSETGKGYALSFNGYPAKFQKLQARTESIAPKDRAIIRA